MGTLFIATTLAGQGLEALDAYNATSLRQQRHAMLGLGAWAVANIGVGLAGRASTQGTQRHFHEMNALWNTVNLAIAGFGYYSALSSDPTTWDLATSLTKHQNFQKILLFNAGLDVGYVVGGFCLRERARRPDANRERLQGFGNSIILQGGFLLVFDVVNYVIATGLNDDLPLRLGATANGLGLLLSF